MNNIKDINSFVSIPGYDSYMINKAGVVIRMSGNNTFYYITISKNKYNNLYFRVSKNNKSKTIYLANVLAMLFIQNPNNSKRVYHIDKDPLNNNIDNLKWADLDTPSKITHNVKENTFNEFIELKNFPSYFINKSGRILRLNKDRKTYKERKHIITNGYRHVTLLKNSKRYHCLVHRLIAESFIPNPHSYRQVIHINKNKLDNSIDNLKWVYTKIKYTNKAKPVYMYDEHGVLQNEYKSLKECNNLSGLTIHIIRISIKEKRLLVSSTFDFRFTLHKSKIDNLIKD